MPVAKDPTARVVAEIVAGRHDGRLKEIIEAVHAQQKQGRVDFVWKITLPDGETWDRRSATIGELAFAEQTARVPWRDLQPGELMIHFAALVTGHYYKAKGLDLDDAITKAEALTEEQAAAAVDDYELVSPPKASTDSTTS